MSTRQLRKWMIIIALNENPWSVRRILRNNPQQAARSTLLGTRPHEVCDKSNEGGSESSTFNLQVIPFDRRDYFTEAGRTTVVFDWKKSPETRGRWLLSTFPSHLSLTLRKPICFELEDTFLTSNTLLQQVAALNTIISIAHATVYRGTTSGQE